MADRVLIQAIRQELKKIKLRYKEKYGTVFFDVNVKYDAKDAIILEGAVLSKKQKNEILSIVRDIAKDLRFKDKISVLSDPKDRMEIGWGVVLSDVADIWSKLLGEKKMIANTRASQAVKTDFLRLLTKKGAWFLAQTGDLAIGWIDSSRIKISKWPVIKKEWMKIKRASPGDIVKKRLSKNIQNKFIHFLKKYSNVQYILGGMTEKGIDCSGLVERFYFEIFNVMLPRHSTDQALCGKKIDLSDAYFGDLVYLRGIKNKRSHVGIVVEKFEKNEDRHRNYNNILILNARQEKGIVAIEDLSEILKSYNLISIRRIIKEL